MANPLAPLPIPPSRKKPKAEARTVYHRLLWPMAGATLIGIAVHSLPLLVLCAAGWTGWFVYYVLLTRVIDPHGDETPYVNQHSEIQSLVMRGEYARAARAYQDVIAADPADVLACEQLVQLARTELKDPQLALWASREAERRHTHQGRKLAFGMIAFELYHRDIGDPRRAAAELQRLLRSYPDAPNAAALRRELEYLKTTSSGPRQTP